MYTDNIHISVGVSGAGCTLTTYISVSVYQEPYSDNIRMHQCQCISNINNRESYGLLHIYDMCFCTFTLK